MTVSDAPANLIGDPADPRGRNILSGNSLAGVQVSGAALEATPIAGNLIGTDAPGRHLARQRRGRGARRRCARRRPIGGTTRRAGNVISGNLLDGVSGLRPGSPPARSSWATSSASTPPARAPCRTAATGVFLWTARRA